MSTIVSDVTYAFRTLRTNAGFTAVAVAALALGIGANTAIFTVVDTVMLAPLPYHDADHIVRLGRKYPGGNGYSNSVPKYMVWRNNDVFSSMALYDQGGIGMNLGTGDHAEQAKISHVSKDYFQVFGASPAMGRTFSAAEDLPNGPAVAILSDRFWKNRLGGDPQIVGGRILLNNLPYTVIGIMPKSFESNPPMDVWLPLQADPASTNQGHYLAAAARLKPGVSIEQARGAMKVAGERFRAQYPQWMDPKESVAVVPLKDSMVENVRLALLILLGAVGFVLLIACANVANLLLARAAVRQKELAIRAAIGASRWRVVRQLLTESLILAGTGAILGFAIGAAGVRALLAMAPGNIPRLTQTDGLHQALPLFDWRIAAFTIGIAALTAILFGLFPALSLSSPDLASTLKEGGRSGGGALGRRSRAFLVVSEVALALVLVTGATLLIRTFSGLRSVNPGINPHNVLALNTSLASGAFDSTAKVDRLVRQVVERLEAIPGVQSANSAVMLPLNGNDVDLPFNIMGRPAPKGGYDGDEQWRFVSPHYFRTLQIPLLRGRLFTDSDTLGAPAVVVINQTMARKYWKSQDPIGQIMVIGRGLGPQFEDAPRQVIGIVGDVKETGLDAVDEGVMYIPQGQVPEGLTKFAVGLIPLSWAVRTAGDPMTVRAAIDREFRAVDATLSPANERTMDQMLEQSLSRQNFNALLLTVFASIALLLAAIGIYGLMSYAVEQRMQEIGIRVALGASRATVLRLMVWQGMKLAVIGIAIGLAAAYAATRVLTTMLFGVKANDPSTFVAVAAMVAIVAALASMVPARRAAGIAPSVALRHQ
ncbi:MAG TPA: ABC transporter permease [Bryobacteraceae bacterium]|nr:ABC transporter permease [Bryobacteraceae bacterium]